MERNLSDALAHHAKSRPQQIALIDGSKEISYAQLNDLVNWAAVKFVDDDRLAKFSEHNAGDKAHFSWT